MICNVFCYSHTISNNCAKYEHPLSKNEGGVRVTSHKLIISIFVSIFDLVFDTNGKAVIRNLCCNLHPIGNYCAIYEHPQS